MCGIGPVGEALHIRPRPAGGGSAESCGNVPAFNTVEILPCAEGSALHMGDRPLKTDVLGRVAESCGKHGIRLRGRPFRMCSTPAIGPRRPCTVREGPRREADPARTPRGGMSAVRVVARWTEARTPRAGGMARTLEAGGADLRARPRGRGGGRSRHAGPCSRKSSRPGGRGGRDVRDVVDDGDDAGERGERSGHADRGADARESVMLVTESFRRLPRGTRRKPPSALVAEGATTTTCCGRG